jgi:hypothetical protein
MEHAASQRPGRRVLWLEQQARLVLPGGRRIAIVIAAAE